MKERSELETNFDVEKKRFAAERETLETKPVHSLRELREVEKALAELSKREETTNAHHTIRFNRLMNMLRDTASPAIDNAVRQAEQLRYQPQGSVSEQSKRLRGTIPALNGETEEIETLLAVARGLVFPRERVAVR